MDDSPCYSGNDYLDKFNPSVFLERYADVRPDTRSGHMLRYYHTAFHNIPNGVSVLDYGSGPSILPTISAASKTSEIVLSDFSAVNRQALRDWLDNKEPPLFDWTDHFRYVVRELEGKGEEEVTRRQQEIRNVVKDVVHCDITQDPLIDAQYHKLYDVYVHCIRGGGSC